jgi:ankyrin repeat protein
MAAAIAYGRSSSGSNNSNNSNNSSGPSAYYETNSKIQQLNPTSWKLLEYCKDNNPEWALYILNQGNSTINYLNYNMKDPKYNNTAFIWACKNNMTSVINRFINIAMNIHQLLGYENKPFNLNEQNNHGKTALMYICTNGLYDQLIKLIDHTFNRFSNNPEYFLDVNIQDNDGNTALIIAMKNNQVSIVNELLDFPYTNMYLENKYKKNFIDIAEEKYSQYLLKIKAIRNYQINNRNLGLIINTAKAKKKELNSASRNIASGILGTSLHTKKIEAQKNYNNSKKALKYKIREILNRIKTDSLDNKYKIKMIQTIYQIAKDYSIADIKTELERNYR